jgi:hypothetical protein
VGLERKSSSVSTNGARAPVNTQLVDRSVDLGNFEVDRHAIRSDRRDRVAQRLKWHSGVKQRERNLLAR